MALPLTDRAGTLAAAQATTGVSANTVNAGAWDAVQVAFQVAMSASASLNIENSIDGGTTWTAVAPVNANTGASVTVPIAAAGLFVVTNPSGLYRANASANTGTLTVRYRVGTVDQE